MKQHLAHQWQDLSTMQLINWPYVEVKFCIQDIYFVRRQATSFERHLNFQLNEQCKNANHSVIESAERVCTHSCFTNKFIEEYFKEYISSLKGKVSLFLLCFLFYCLLLYLVFYGCRKYAFVKMVLF